MVDRVLLLRKMATLDEYLGQISEYSRLTLKEYIENWKTQRIIERTLQMMIEICADMASHIISDRGYRVPKSYGDTFKVLQENEVIGEDLYHTMDRMVKFRNVIVHDYDKVDAEIVISILQKNLNDFRVYKEAILTFIKFSAIPVDSSDHKESA